MAREHTIIRGGISFAATFRDTLPGKRILKDPMMPTTPKCLLVDDAESMLRVLCLFMENLGFEPITAHDGDEGIALVREQKPDLVVSDIHMPNRNGLLLLKDIKALNPDLPVILITGYMNFKADVINASLQPDAFMEKPFTLDDLRGAVTKLKPAIEHAWQNA
jgi:DNA-binding NtrC family response regulator